MMPEEALEIADPHTDDAEMATDARRADSPSTGTDAVLDRDKIARLAYERFERRGGGHGLDQEDWYEAERALKARASE